METVSNLMLLKTMAKTPAEFAKGYDQIDFEASKVAFEYKGTINPNYSLIVKKHKDGPEYPIAQVGNSYGLVNHRDAFETVQNSISDRGLDFGKANILTWENGAIMDTRWTISTDQKVAVGDPVGFELILQNSINGRKRFTLKGGLKMLICSNGMTSFDKKSALSIEFKHRESIHEHIQNINLQIDSLLNVFHADIQKLQLLPQLEVSQQHGLIIIDNIARTIKLTKEDLDNVNGYFTNPDSGILNPDAKGKGLRGITGETRNAWDIYNSLTAHLRDVEKVNPTLADKKRETIADIFNGFTGEGGSTNFNRLMIPDDRPRRRAKVETVAN